MSNTTHLSDRPFSPSFPWSVEPNTVVSETQSINQQPFKSVKTFAKALTTSATS